MEISTCIFVWIEAEMFTGLIEGQGRVTGMERRGGDVLFRFCPLFSWDKPAIGESVACNGVCLTMESWISSGSEFTAFASAETLSCSNLGSQSVGSVINMERAMQMGERFGGHIVSGHVDTVARVDSVRPVGRSRCIRLVFAPEWSRQIVAKGSVTLDGISLTVNSCGNGFLEVNIIPETWRVTTVANWRAGSAVNLETDIIGKYVSHLMHPVQEQHEESHVTMDFLRRNGFGV
jgi:riboflavin synthase